MTAVSGGLRDPADIDTLIRERRMSIVRDLGPQGTLWLAAPPLWTRSAAETTGFPVKQDESVTDFVQRARTTGWCKIRGSLRADSPAELHFWMPDEVREDVLDAVRQLPNGGNQAVQDRAREVAESVVRHESEADLPGALRAWAKLYTEVEPEDIPACLLDRVQEAVHAGDYGGAQELVSAGKALDAVVEGPGSDLTRAQAMLDSGLEQSRNAVTLSRYLDRRELSDAVASLLADGTDKWALHLRGVGGVGKTMFIRYLKSGRFVEERMLPSVSMACVNFDHVSPAYPAQEPVRLLLELADELRLHAAFSDQAYQALRAFYDQADSVQEAASSRRDDITWALDPAEADHAIDAFAQVIGELGNVLLILDTCEELARWNPGNLNSSAILATLQMLERLHEQTGSLRVLLAGRRPLPPRTWLESRVVPGFTVAQARRYLALPGDRTLSADLVEAIIGQSRAIDPSVSDRGQPPEWVNPFDLALYRAWANEDPGPSVADIESGNDAYVDSRIIQRLSHDQLAMRSLPMLAAGGRCRVETIATTLDCGAATLGRQLAALEWIEAEGSVPPSFVTAWPSMAERLRRYYSALDHQTEFSQAMHRFAVAIRHRLDDDPQAPIDVDEVTVALRWADPAAAARLWDLMTARAAQPPGRWDVVGMITVRILGLWDDEPDWPTTGALRAAVLAAHIAAHRREMPPDDARELWAQVLDTAGRHPDPARQSQLRALAALGTLSHDPSETSLWDVLRAESGSLMASPAMGTAAVDTLHRLLEGGYADHAGRLRELLDLESFGSVFRDQPGANPALPPSAADRPVAWADVAEARLLADSDPPGARARLANAERLAAAATGTEWAWPYWTPPDDLLARVRIERGLIDKELITGATRLTKLEPWEDYAARRLRSIDRERLASLCLQLRLQHGVVPAEVAEQWESADAYMPGRAATDSVHDLVPPLFVSVAEAWLAAGQPQRGLALLDGRRSKANATRGDEATVRHADAGTVRLARRLRLADRRSLLARVTDPVGYRSAARMHIAMLDDARRAWAVIYRESPPDVLLATDRLEGWHAWWQCQTAQERGPVPAVPWSPESQDASQPGLEDLQADLLERYLLGWRDLEQVREDLAAYAASRPVLARSVGSYRDLRQNLRWLALDRMISPLAAKAPKRLVAETAFEEAELLALRLPDAAAQFYFEAALEYGRCGDQLGKLLALVAFHDTLSGCSEDSRNALLSVLPAGAGAQRPLLGAWHEIAEHQPGLAAILAGPPQAAGVWRFWAEALQRNLGTLPAGLPADHRVAPVIAVAEPKQTTPRRGGRLAIAVRRVLFGSLALPLAVVFDGRVRPAFRLASGRGIGVARIERLMFEASADEAANGEPTGTVQLQVRLLSQRSSPVQIWSRLRMGAMAWTLRLLRRGWPGRPVGYSGALDPRASSSDTAEISWTPRPASPPDTWWQRRPGTPVSGTIRTSRFQARRPWERILTQSLGPAAPGRIEWVRLAADQIDAVDSGGRGVELIAAPVRDHSRAELDSPHPPGPRVRHVIGRAVRTSAGPCMDVSGETRPSPGPTLLTVRALGQQHPLVVVLQAEPARGKDVRMVQHYDLEDKIRLAMALLEDGIPAVLILPMLSSRLAREAAQLVTAFADTGDLGGQDVRAALLRPLRGALTQYGEPSALDDLILFLNARYA